ncbi:MAG: NAD-dependent epimerase [Gammaproteobacteria bacterium]|nr:NAD-dependent epimerase [Gammaproteobacteria bacterium]
MTILVTGAAGFIGFHVAQALISEGRTVIGIDNLNAYYDISLKNARLDRLKTSAHFSFLTVDIADQTAVENLFKSYKISKVIHLAAQPGVRYSLENPHYYIQANLVGFFHIIEACRQHKIEHLIYASSSSVYGANTQQPFSENTNTDHPMSLYAATKKSNELMAHSYASLYQLPCTGLRFFTVYGPWGRPDMALSLFTYAILKNQPIDLYNHGKMLRDFTYIDDAVNAILLSVNHPAKPDPNWSGQNPQSASSYAPYRIYNVGNNKPVNLMQYIAAIELATGKKALINNLPAQAGDLLETAADISAIQNELGYVPNIDIHTGVQNFVDWYRAYYAL